MLQVLKAVYEILSPREKRRAAVVLTLMLATALFELLGVGSILPFLAMVMDPGIVERNPALRWAFTTFGFANPSSFILATGVAILVVMVLMNVVSAVALWTQMRFIYNLGHSISTRLLARYLAQPYAYFLTRNSAAMTRNVLSETQRLVSGVLTPGVLLLSKAIVVAAVVAFLLAVEPWITLGATVAIGGTYGLVYALVRRRLLQLGRESFEINQTRHQINAEAFGGIKAIKSLGVEAHFVGAYKRASATFASRRAMDQIYSRLPRYLVQTLAFGGFMGGVIVLLALGEDLTELIPVMGFFAFAVARLLPAFQEIVSSLARFRFHEHLLRRIHADLVHETSPARTARGPAPSPLPFNRHIRLDGVRFRYPGAERDVLERLTLEIPHNSSLALVGTTGSGKTTVVDIILGLLAPDEGQLLVDDTPITADNVADWRRRVGYVPQDVFLSDETVEKNIAFGVGEREIDRAAVERAARIAQIHDFIVGQLPQGYESRIGERGVRLSGGQRQRLGIARALYRDPDVLVLDEATSDIDNVTEAQVAEAIEQLAGRKTLIMVAHRLSTIRRCDRIVLMEEGGVVGSGTYDELVATSGRFRRLAQPHRAEAAG